MAAKNKTNYVFADWTGLEGPSPMGVLSASFARERFDRNAKGERIHFASAMTLLGYNDGADHHEGVSYLELAEFIMQNGTNVDEELKELWKRIVLNICIKNTDDHLRNHGFLVTDAGWVLSPIYDVNPFPEGTGLTLNISEDDNSLDLALTLSVAEYFRLKEKEATSIIEQIKSSVSNWRKIAQKNGLSKKEQDLMEPALQAENISSNIYRNIEYVTFDFV